MIQLAHRVDPDARAIRKRYEDEVEAPTEVASEKIARARFKVLGTSTYPDATFTLRVNFGTVQAWVEKGEPVAPFTTLKVAYDRTTGKKPFSMPPRWVEQKGSLDPSTRFNLSTNNDIVGGNSGSPAHQCQGRAGGSHVRRQHSLDLGLLLVRCREEPGHCRGSDDHEGSTHQGVSRRRAGEGDLGALTGHCGFSTVFGRAAGSVPLHGILPLSA